jgi:hypothetical protein
LIADTTELLTTTVNNLDKTNIELRNAKSDFNKRLKGIYNNDLRIDENWISKDLSIVECTSSKQELEKTRAYFTKTIDDLSAKLNGNFLLN